MAYEILLNNGMCVFFDFQALNSSFIGRIVVFLPMEQVRLVAFVDPGNFSTFHLCGVIKDNGGILYLLNSKEGAENSLTKHPNIVPNDCPIRTWDRECEDIRIMRNVEYDATMLRKLLLQSDQLSRETKYLLGSLVSDEVMKRSLVSDFHTGRLHIQLSSSAATTSNQSYQTLWQRCSNGIIIRWDGHFFMYKTMYYPIPMSCLMSKGYSSIEWQRINGDLWTVTSAKNFKDPCIVCGTERSRAAQSAKLCPCRDVKYCSRECQIMHWPLHKKNCKFVAPCIVCGEERSIAAQTVKQCPCRMAKYCSRECQLMDWPLHKTQCEYQSDKQSSS